MKTPQHVIIFPYIQKQIISGKIIPVKDIQENYFHKIKKTLILESGLF